MSMDGRMSSGQFAYFCIFDSPSMGTGVQAFRTYEFYPNQRRNKLNMFNCSHPCALCTSIRIVGQCVGGSVSKNPSAALA